MRRAAVTLALALAALGAASSTASAQVRLEAMGSFTFPVHVASPPGDPSRIFVVERRGVIRLIKNGQTLTTPFLSIVPEVESSSSEEGLLSIAFAPDYATSGRFYVYFNQEDGGNNDIMIRGYNRSSNPDVADPASGDNILEVPHTPNQNHNGGQMQFGPDGLLYAAPGDGAVSANAQSSTSQLGKLLRLAPNATGPGHGGQPSSDAPAEIVSSGLRNPWRFAFDRQTGDLVIGDVGQSDWEEINFVPSGQASGKNFGWPICEANQCSTTPPANYWAPVLAHPNPPYHAIIAGYVVRNSALPSLNGRFIYGDNSRQELRAATLTGPQSASGDGDIGLSIAGLTSFGEDVTGCIYAASAFGPVYRIAPTAGGQTCQLASPAPGGGGTGGGGTTTTTDGTAPELSLGVRRRQRILRTRAVKGAARCDERCRIVATGRLTVPGASRVFRLRTIKRTVSGGRRSRLIFRVSARRRSAVRRALVRGDRVTARVRVMVTDAAGNRRTSRPRRVLVVRR